MATLTFYHSAAIDAALDRARAATFDEAEIPVLLRLALAHVERLASLPGADIFELWGTAFASAKKTTDHNLSPVKPEMIERIDAVGQRIATHAAQLAAQGRPQLDRQMWRVYRKERGINRLFVTYLLLCLLGESVNVHR